MPSRTVVVASAVGLHARPASIFVQAVLATGAAVTLTLGERSVNAASILGVLSLGVPHGATVVISSDDEKALIGLAALLESDLDA